ncbi:MAG TPA: hypothetical protein VEX86_09235 [Longimicrobium sp.]|nr:hypothetical protein [Longimicrobium sp.]
MDRADNRTGIFHTINGETREIVVERPDRRLLEIYSSWTPAQRLQAAAEQTRYMLQALAAQLQSLHPDWSPQQVNREVARRQLEDRL